jgi:hypothetical protein
MGKDKRTQLNDERDVVKVAKSFKIFPNAQHRGQEKLTKLKTGSRNL